MEGRAHATLQYRKLLGAKVAIFADVAVKHARPLSNPDISRAAKDTAYRGLADALIVTGPATGQPADLDEIRRVAAAVPDRRVFVGSGATIETVAQLLTVAGGVIVGTGIKQGGHTENPIDPDRARAFARAAGR
jgi:membrane complex biogenesis BtpA family protein